MAIIVLVFFERIHDNNADPKLRSFKLLGVHFDEYLTFNKHISHVSAKLTRANFCLRRIANFISIKTLRTLYFSIFHSHLLYCSIITSCASQTSLNKVITLQKKAITVESSLKSKCFCPHPPPSFYALISSHLINF